MNLRRLLWPHVQFGYTARLLRTHYGRSAGWEVYLHGQKLAELLAPEFDDRFWVSYELHVCAPAYGALLRTIDFWYEHPIVFKSKALNTLSGPYVMIVVPNDRPDGRVLARSLYVSHPSRLQGFLAACVDLLIDVLRPVFRR